MADFPRTVTPASVTDLDIPGPLISTSQSGRVQLRSIQHSGWMWRETFLLNTRLTLHKNFLAQVRNLWRNGTSFDIAHVDYAALAGAGGGSPIVQAATQLVSLPENFGGWTVVGTPILTAGQSDPLGGTAAYLIEDNDAAAFEHMQLVVAFTGDATKCISLYMKQGTATKTWFRLRGAAERHRVIVTWAGGVPTLATSAGSGALYTPEQHPTYTDWYRISISAASVVAADTNVIEFGPGDFLTTSIGTGYYFGANAWNEVSPARYSGPSNPGNEPTGPILYVNGATASVSNWLRAGDPVSVTVGTTPRILQATADVSTQANGYVAIPINPPLYTGSAPVDNSAVTISGTKVRACLIEPPQFPETSGQSADYGNLVLTFREVG
jgi:hypothetical protein